MIQKSELERILRFVGNHWNEVAGDPAHRAVQGLPSGFWMNSLGGKAGKGFWVTTIMYTEDRQFAETFKDVLTKWQGSGMEKSAQSDLIQIGKKG